MYDVVRTYDVVANCPLDRMLSHAGRVILGMIFPTQTPLEPW